MNQIEIDNALTEITAKCADEMKHAGVDSDAEHKAIIDKYALIASAFGVTRIQLMVSIGRYTGALKNWQEIYQ